MSVHRIAVIAGDGIGQEVMPEGLRALEAAADRFGIGLAFDHFDFPCCTYYQKHGQMLPDNWKDQIGGHDAIYFGAVGWPDKVPDHVSLWGSLLMFRREFEPELLAIWVDAEHLTFRSLRKAVAAAVSDTAGVEVARDLLGHSSTDITEGHYAKRPDLIVEVAADALDEAFAGIDA